MTIHKARSGIEFIDIARYVFPHAVRGKFNRKSVLAWLKEMYGPDAATDHDLRTENLFYLIDDEKRWTTYGLSYYFKNEKDAILFKVFAEVME